MKRRQTRASIEGALLRWADTLGVNQWLFSFDGEMGVSGVLSVSWDHHYRFATIAIAAAAFDLSDDELERAAAHEMLHLALVPIKEALGDCVGINGFVYKMIGPRFEEVIDHLANRLILLRKE